MQSSSTVSSLFIEMGTDPIFQPEGEMTAIASNARRSALALACAAAFGLAAPAAEARITRFVVDPALSQSPTFEGRTFGSVGAYERSEEHTSELQSHVNLVCRLLLEKKNI